MGEGLGDGMALRQQPEPRPAREAWLKSIWVVVKNNNNQDTQVDQGGQQQFHMRDVVDEVMGERERADAKAYVKKKSRRRRKRRKDKGRQLIGGREEAGDDEDVRCRREHKDGNRSMRGDGMSFRCRQVTAKLSSHPALQFDKPPLLALRRNEYMVCRVVDQSNNTYS